MLEYTLAHLPTDLSNKHSKRFYFCSGCVFSTGEYPKGKTYTCSIPIDNIVDFMKLHMTYCHSILVHKLTNTIVKPEEIVSYYKERTNARI